MIPNLFGEVISINPIWIDIIRVVHDCAANAIAVFLGPRYERGLRYDVCIFPCALGNLAFANFVGLAVTIPRALGFLFFRQTIRI